LGIAALPFAPKNQTLFERKSERLRYRPIRWHGRPTHLQSYMLLVAD
jgi:hypothetical protein